MASSMPAGHTPRPAGSEPTASSDLLASKEGDTLRRLDRGKYLTLGRPATIVRSTISIAFSHDGRYFASTNGDHSVKVFRYPSGEQIACLDGHPVTPWTVRFHPKDSSILASGCLGCECRVWDVSQGECIRKHIFASSISCVSFNPDGSLLAITSGSNLLLWNYMEAAPNNSRSTSSAIDDIRGPGVPRKLLGDVNPFHMVDFHPSGTMLMTGEKNRSPPSPTGARSNPEEQFTLKLVIYRYDGSTMKTDDDPVLEVPRAVAYNEAGIHFSPCGTMLAACIPVHEHSDSFKIAVMSLVERNQIKIGTVMYETALDRGHVTTLTNLKFSPTSHYLLAGFSFRPKNPILRGHAEHYGQTTGQGADGGMRRPNQVGVVDIYKVSEKFEMIRSLRADMDLTKSQEGGADDEINVAVFAPVAGVADGVVYGTQKGRIRMFQQATGADMEAEPLDEDVAIS